VPNSDGGLYAYARHEFGDFAGYLTGWCYWVQAWAGNAAIVSSWVSYVDALLGWHPSGIGNWGIALIGLWVPALVNLAGVKQVAWFQNVTVVLKFLPLLFVGVAGWFFVSTGNFGAFNASGGSLYDAIGIAAGVALFSFIGVEVAAITAKRVKDPRRNVGRASVLGTAASAIVYLLVSAAVMGLVSHQALVNNGAPFVKAFQSIFTGGAWAGKLVAAVAVGGYTAIYQALLAIFIGLAIYPFLKARRERLGQIPAPVDIAATAAGDGAAALSAPCQAPPPTPAPRRCATGRHWHQPEPGRTVMTSRVQSEVAQL